jgi:hypothetical protein
MGASEMICCRWVPCALAMVLLAGSATRASAQVKYDRGQSVAPVFEGWERNADGSFNMVFGYMNRNYEEQVEVPIGPDNMMGPGAADQGQPTHFSPRRQEYVFKVRVPKDWGEKDLLWKLTSHGKTETAYGKLKPIWELGNLVYQENRGGPGDLTYPEEPNQPPSIEMVGSSQRTVGVRETLTLSVQVTDDGHPSPRARRPNAAPGPGGRGSAITSSRTEAPITQAVVKLEPGVRLGVTWVVFRGGPGIVTFDPAKVPVVSVGPPGSAAPPGPLSGRATTNVTFSEPGTYRLRAYADDGVLLTPLDVNVTVIASAGH